MPLLFDFPLETLKTYEGINPCPADMDAFWETGLEEMRALDWDVQLEPAAFQAPHVECFDLTFTGVMGARIYAKFVRPKKITAQIPAIVEFHGYTGASRDWVELLSYAGAGFCVAALDCRGQAGRSEDVGGVLGNTLDGLLMRGFASEDPRKLYFRNVFLDTAQLAHIVMDRDEVDATRVGAMGGSQGGALTLVCAALEPRIKAASSMYPFLCDYKRVWEMDQDVAAYRDIRRYLRECDPLHERADALWEKLGYIDVQHLVKRIRAEVLMATSLMDTICPPSTQFAAYNKITAPKHMDIYPDFGHEHLPHFGSKTFTFMCEKLGV